jgi:hypothetical protein
MVHRSFLVVCAALVGAVGAVATACSSEDATTVVPEANDGGSTDGVSNVDGSEIRDPDASDTCTYDSPVVKDPGPCGAPALEEPALLAEQFDGGAFDYVGGPPIPDGIYDLVKRETLDPPSNVPGRETWVVKGTHYTQATESGSKFVFDFNNAGSLAYETTDGGGRAIRLTEECTQSGDGGATDAGFRSSPYRVDVIVSSDCKSVLVRRTNSLGELRETFRRR